MLDDFECGSLIFKSKFDSGNLGRVELVAKKPEGDTNVIITTPGATTTVTVGQQHGDGIAAAKEFNLFTHPDCGGTIYENGNRTWFFFGVRGGEPQQIIKFNMMNLNRQAKLYSQGMHPVFRIGYHGKWDRIKDKPTYIIENDNFILTFIHRVPDEPSSIIFYAFTYPFTCGDLDDHLTKLDKRFGKTEHQFEYILKALNVKPADTVSLPEAETVITGGELGDDTTSSKVEIVIQNNEPRKFKDCIEKMRRLSSPGLIDQEKVSIKSMKSIEDPVSPIFIDKPNIDYKNDIYYYRELLIYSLQGRPVEMLTITSFNGICNEREPNLENLFPNQQKRCHKFTNKKVIFLSSRVHPGETPASFILNGFINFILDKKSIIAATLRNTYVFKIVPFLNPDGVYNGMYRSDTLGQNLNRVYLTPKLETQPTIYAAKKLIQYYHYGFEKRDADEPERIDHSKLSRIPCLEELAATTSRKVEIEDVENEPEMDSTRASKEGSTESSSSGDDIKIGIESGSVVPKCEKSQSVPPSQPKGALKLSSTSFNVSTKIDRSKSLTSDRFIKPTNVKKSSIPVVKKDPKSTAGNNKSPIHQILGQFRGRPDETTITDETQGNLFLYVDFHGHASKKGVFMYGNHLPSVQESVECMLLPRLMSINSHHFHFDACNFSERNMYLKGKRDGLSKEGSGRVAIYKAIGLVKCYTLEGNYNTGKVVNILPPRGKELASKMVNMNPPKYSPAVFEEVGRALGPSILDLTNSNPISRIGNSDFRTLQGLRNALKFEIDRSFARNGSASTPKARPNKTRRMKNSLIRTNSTQIDASKENKALYDMPWDLLNHQTPQSGLNNVQSRPMSSSILPSSSCAAFQPPTTNTTTNVSSSSTTSKLHNSNTKLAKKILSKSQTIFGKKESSLASKKIKIFCDPSGGPSGLKLSSKGTSIIDQQIQVPRKRIKVASISSSTVPATVQIASGSLPDELISLSNFYPSTSDLLLDHQPNAVDLFNEMPCCSSSLVGGTKSPPSSNLLKTLNRPSTAGTGIPGKVKVRKSSSLPNLAKKATGDGTKLKKKRILKTEIGLKRKKSRVKTVWH